MPGSWLKVVKVAAAKQCLHRLACHWLAAKADSAHSARQLTARSSSNSSSGRGRAVRWQKLRVIHPRSKSFVAAASAATNAGQPTCSGSPVAESLFIVCERHLRPKYITSRALGADDARSKVKGTGDAGRAAGALLKSPLVRAPIEASWRASQPDEDEDEDGARCLVWKKRVVRRQ